MSYYIQLIINWIRYKFNINLFAKKDEEGYRQ